MSFDPDAGIISIPIREGVTVKIAGLPFDLTTPEAEKLARVVRAFSTDKMTAMDRGKKGGAGRAKALSPERRSEIARDAAHARFGTKPRKEGDGND